MTTLGLLAIVVISLRNSRGQALRKVLAEVKAIRRRGEPIEPKDVVALCPSPADMKRDEEWLRLCSLSAPLDKFTDDVRPLPLIGELDVPDDALSRSDSESLREQARTYLAKHGDTLRLAHELASDAGPVPYPQDFEEGFTARLPWIVSLRALSRVLSLELRLRAAEGDWEGACASWTAMLAVSESLRPMPCGVSCSVVQSMRFGMLLKTIKQADFLINHGQLSDSQLLKLRDQLLALRPELDLRQMLLGERVMGYVGFEHPEQILDAALSGKSIEANLATRAEDCLLYLETMRDVIDSCGLPYAEWRPRAIKSCDNAMRRAVPLSDGGDNRFAGTVSLLPGVMAFAIDYPAEPMAARDIMVLVIACRRFLRQRGRLPATLSELKPEFCSEIATDPYSGKPLLTKPSEHGIFIYSVGKNGIDDGGTNDRTSGDISFEVIAAEDP